MIIENPTTHEVDVVITRFVEEHQPNIVEWRLTDIHGHEWVFVDKDAYASVDCLDEDSHYPLPGAIQCVILDELTDEAGERFYRIDTVFIWSSEEDASIFDVRHVRPRRF